MRKWITSQNRKKHQRAINSLMRKINRDIENDPMWKGRYCVRQHDAKWMPYWEEPDYYVFYVQFILYDKKTHKTYITHYDSDNTWLFLGGHRLWLHMNDFILESGVWQEEPRPTYENTPDFRNVSV